MENQKTKIIIVDDHQLFADGLKRIIEDLQNYDVIKICNNWEELRMHINLEIPDLIMLDIQMKDFDGVEICKILKKKHPNIKIIFISMLDSSEIVHLGKKIGANGYIPKTTNAMLVKKTIENVLNGIDSFIHNNNNEKSNSKKPTPFLITTREKEIIKLIKSGYTTSLIAEKLCISKYTVDTHRKNILKKLKLNSIKDLIGFAYENYF